MAAERDPVTPGAAHESSGNARLKAAEGQTGTALQGLTLPTFIQMLAMDKVSCRLEVGSGEHLGRLDFVGGDLVDAELEGLRGFEAACAIAALPAPVRLHIADGEPAAERSIREPVMAVLLESASRSDAERAGTRDVGSRDADDFREESGYMVRLEEILSRFRDEVPSFVSTDIVHLESGLSIGGGAMEGEIDTAAAPAAYSEVVKANAYAMKLLGLGGDSTEDILVTTGKVYFLLRMLTGDYYHLLAVSRRGNLGLARVLMKKYHASLVSAVRDLS
jgi:predicted regulator of Ras-like GTPase activity (Roadblock/LC7/MglB family)